MVRPRKCRVVGYIPNNNYFYPKSGCHEEVCLSIEELESIRLSDAEMLDQDSAAKSMNISRGTYQRILNNARQKVADAILNGKCIHIIGGDYEVQSGACCCKDKKSMCDCSTCERCEECVKENK